ncbi:GTP pyrophosphokinase [Geomicrobium sp. JCM 19055]|nr:GTP pyrophosphokinase [Geomicrobium sp. JCM 19055]
MTIEQLLERAAEYMSQEHVDFIHRAYLYAEKEHEGQYRKSGEPYIHHPVQVAGILIELKLEPATIAGAFFT